MMDMLMIIISDEIIVRVICNKQIRKHKMGGNQSKQGHEDNVQAPRVNHPRFQNIKFTRNKEDEDCIEVKISVANIKEYNQWVSALKDAPTQSQNFLLPQTHEFQKQGLCGSSGYVNVLFQNFPYILADQIRNRASLKQKYFDEPELWYLIYTLISAGHEFHKNGKKIGDVRPENVFINEDGQVKVATHLTWPSENTNYHKTFYQKQVTYLSPEELKDIQFAKMEPSCDPKSAESFSIGLTCLDAGTLGSSTPLYLKSSKFDYNGLSSRLQQLHNTGYSDILCMVVSNLCEPDSDRRSTCSELYKWLEPHQENIINLQAFSVNSLPQKFAQLGLNQEYDSSINQSALPPQNGVNQSPGSSPYNGHTSVPNSYISSSQTQASTIPPQLGGQTVTYYQVPAGQPVNFPPPFIRPPQQGYPQTIDQPGQNFILNPPPLPAGQQIQVQGTQLPPSIISSQQQPPAQSVQVIQSTQNVQPNQSGQYSENRTTTSTYTYSQYPPGNQYVSPTVTNSQYSQNVQYIRAPVSNNFQGEGDRQKSNMELTLEKIDEQLQMSRKMFPS